MSGFISDGVTVPLTAEPRTIGSPVGGFGRWGGQRGGAMCFSEFADASVEMSNGDDEILVAYGNRAIEYAARIPIARSSAVWGIVSRTTARLKVQDPARPRGVQARLIPFSVGLDAGTPVHGAWLQIFVIPVTTGPVTVTAFDKEGHQTAAAAIAAA